MRFLPSFKKNTALTVVPKFRTPETQQLAERFENIKNIADPADRLLMLEKIRIEAEDRQRTEYDFKANEFHEGKEVLACFGTTALFGAVGAVFSGGVAVALLFPGFASGIVLGTGLKRNANKNYDKNFKDLAVSHAIETEAQRLKQELLETVDTKVIARSPSGIEAFTKFPSLKEKFMLALTIDRALANERAALSLPDLGKVSKPATRKK